MRVPGKLDPVSWALSALTDNPWTRSWNNLVTEAVIQPVERLVGGSRVVSDDTLARLAQRIDSDVSQYGNLSTEMYAVLSTYVDPNAEWGKIAQNVAKLRAHDVPEPDRQAAIMTMLARDTAYQPGMVATKDQLPEGVAPRNDEINLELTDTVRDLVVGPPSRAYTEGGNVMRQYVLGSPTASYLAGGAGLAAAVQGAMSLADTLGIGGEQQPKKEERKEKAKG